VNVQVQVQVWFKSSIVHIYKSIFSKENKKSETANRSELLGRSKSVTVLNPNKTFAEYISTLFEPCVKIMPPLAELR
jgi:hypothetical protein